MISNITDMRAAIEQRAIQAGLRVECSCDGALHADVAIVAEAPGDREVSTKRPLVGGSGTLLFDKLRGQGVTRFNAYVTNVSKRQVSFGNDQRHPINKHELAQWKTLLLWELEQLPNLRTILVLGNVALEALTGRTGIMHWRGSVLLNIQLGNRTVDVVCTVNPAMVLREPKLEISFVYDCAKLDRVRKGLWHVTMPRVHINPTFSDAMDYMAMLEQQGKPTAYDIESIGNETACIGFANHPDEAMCVNFRTMSENRYTLQEEVALRKRIQKFFKHPDVPLVAQNNAFDASWLSFKDRINVKPIWHDTMLAHHCLYPPLPHDLGYITTQYTTRPYYKNEKDEWREGGNIDDFWRYNGQDCCNTLVASAAMHNELKQQGLADFFYGHVMRVQPNLVRMSVGGLLVNMAKRETFDKAVGTHVMELLATFHETVKEVTGDPNFEPNPRSPKQLTELLFSRLRLVGRGTSTDDENRARMYAHPATTEPKRKVLRALNKYAKEAKFYSTYVATALDDDGRMRCTYRQTGVVSAPGRLSSAGMLWRNAQGDQTGMNLQNQPDRAHELYVADPGYGLGYFDLSQAEARAVGWYANIPMWIEQFERARIDRSYDAHRALASDMFGIEYDKVPAKDRDKDGSITIRYIAKRCRHGLNYRMGADRLSTITGLSLAHATEAYKKYHRITPELQRWWTSLEAEVRATKTLFNAYGRRSIIMERITPEALESIVAFKPQSTIGDKVVRVIWQSEADPRWPLHARMWLNIHDALVILAPLEKVELCLSIAKKYAEEPIIINGRPLIIPADTKVSVPDEDGFYSWASMEERYVEAAK